jgi:hypothetical protein
MLWIFIGLIEFDCFYQLSMSSCLFHLMSLLSYVFLFVFHINAADFIFHFYLHFTLYLTNKHSRWLAIVLQMCKMPTCLHPQGTIHRWLSCAVSCCRLCWSYPDVRPPQPGGPKARVSVLPFWSEDRKSGFQNVVILLKYRQWTKSKKSTFTDYNAPSETFRLHFDHSYSKLRSGTVVSRVIVVSQQSPHAVRGK